MRNYNYTKAYHQLLTPEIVGMLSQIHEYKGAVNTAVHMQRETLCHLIPIAKIQSTESSNKIEGIYTSKDRLQKILKDKTMPQTSSEKEIAGYRDVLTTIHESYAYIPLKPSMILQLHRDLYKFSGLNIGGTYKISDHLISVEDAQGNERIRFQPVPAWETAESVENACTAFHEANRSGQYDPLLLIPMFILDFLCIYPFQDGNGRMSRLLTTLLLYRAQYDVGKYISIEGLIEKSRTTYYEVLQESSQNWHEEKNDYMPFVRYLLGVILAAYREVSQRAEVLMNPGIRKPNRVSDVIRQHLGKITKAEIMEKCPDISQTTVQRALNDMVKSGDVIKIGGGRYTAYTWNRERE